MMRILKHITVLLAALGCAASCIYPYEVDIEGTDGVVVVEGDILAGDYTTVVFSYMNSKVSGKDVDQGQPWSSYYPGVIPSSTAPFSVVIEGEDGSCLEGQGKGSCTLDTRKLNTEQRYRMRVQDKTSGKKYTSAWVDVAAAPVIDELKYEVTSEQLQFLITFHSDGSTPYYNMVYDEQWQYNALASSSLYWEDGQVVDKGVSHPNQTCWNRTPETSKIVTTGKMASNRMENYPIRTFGVHDRKVSVQYFLTVKAKMISRDAYEYWENLDKISSQSGDLFAPTPSDVRGNITCDGEPDALVLGYISASEVHATEIGFDNRKEVFYRADLDLLERYILRDPEQPGSMLFYMGYEPYFAVYSQGKDEGIDHYDWIHSRCLDCTRDGGVNTEPEDWKDHFKKEQL